MSCSRALRRGASFAASRVSAASATPSATPIARDGRWFAGAASRAEAVGETRSGLARAPLVPLASSRVRRDARRGARPARHVAGRVSDRREVRA